MNQKFTSLLAICLGLLFGFNGLAQDKKPDDKPPEIKVSSMEQAKEVFLKAWNFEKEHQHEQALVAYKELLDFYQKNNQTQYAISTLNNMGEVYCKMGNLDEGRKVFTLALELALKENDFRHSSQIYHKLGVITNHLANIKEYEEKNPNIIKYPSKEDEKTNVEITSGTYTQLFPSADGFRATSIQLGKSENPYEVTKDAYTKVINLKVRGDFDPSELLTPDQVDVMIQIRKTGYNPVGKTVALVPSIEYVELDETLKAIPRQVKPFITEDFYKQGNVSADEITLAYIQGNKVDKPRVFSDRELFRPGSYQLTVKKAGYDTIMKNIVIYPGEGPFSLPVHLYSSPRAIVCQILSDYLQDQKFIPDDMTLGGKLLTDNSVVKPGEYKLALAKQGYEPIVKNLYIVPDPRPFIIAETMIAVPREIQFEITGDYELNKLLTPDEVALNNKGTKYGDKIRPDTYRLVIRKKGYDLINDRITIEPANAPFILKKFLVSTPRPVDLVVLADFPKDKRLTPRQSTLSRKDITKDERFKPGMFELSIQEGGYESINKFVNIPPDDVPFPIKETLLCKPREVKIDLDRDVPPEDPQIPFMISLINQNTKEVAKVKSGDRILPENYVLKVEQAGYEPDITQHLILPSDEAYNVSRRLIASMRVVVTDIRGEYPENAVLIPDKITLDTKALGKDFLVKPGSHDLVIQSEGYLPLTEQLKILASPNQYLIARLLLSRPRLVRFVFFDTFDGKSLTPDDVFVKEQKIVVAEDQNLKPGKYFLKVRLVGYGNIDEEVEVPVGVIPNPYIIEKRLTAIRREVQTKIKNDFTNDIVEMKNINLFTLNDTPIDSYRDSSSSKIYVRPGKYTAFTQKQGYFEIIRVHQITPGGTPYLIEETLISKPRKLEITTKSSFPFAPKEGVTPDSMKMGVQDVKTGDSLKPKEYQLEIKKKGYKTIQEQVLIEPAETPYILNRTLEALPRQVYYELISDFENKPVEPEVITLNDQNITQNASVIPGKYVVKIEKVGYKSQKMEIIIEPSDDRYLIQTLLISIPRPIDLRITGDYPPDEPITPEVAALSNKEIKQDVTFKPGKYIFEIVHPGFIPLKEDIVIIPGEDAYFIERVLTSLPRTLEEKITFDVKPGDDLEKHKITLASADAPTKETVHQGGDKIKPGEYILRITKQAYEPIEKRFFIWPSPDNQEVKEEMISKQVEVLINISYDVKPPATLTEYTVSVIDRNNIPKKVEHGNKIKPDQYKLKVDRPGYSFGPVKSIYIAPSEKSYQISEKLTAMPRPLSFSMLDAVTNELVPAYKIINTANSQEVTYKDLFPAGKEVNLTVKFKTYKTVNKSFYIEPGEGPYVANVPLTKLKAYEFAVTHLGKDKKRPPYTELDSIEYEYAVYVDTQELEEHLLEKVMAPGNKWYYTIQAEQNANDLQVFGGYLFAQKSIQRPGPVPPFDSINVSRLTDHLTKVRKTEGKGVKGLIEVMEVGLRATSWRRMLAKCASKDIDQLITFLESIPGDDTERMRIKAVIDLLTKLGG